MVILEGGLYSEVPLPQTCLLQAPPPPELRVGDPNSPQVTMCFAFSSTNACILAISFICISVIKFGM